MGNVTIRDRKIVVQLKECLDIPSSLCDDGHIASLVWSQSPKGSGRTLKDTRNAGWFTMGNQITGVYAITGPNRHVYIGESFSIHGRWAQHKEALDEGKHPCRVMQRHWNKHSVNFRFAVVEQCLAHKTQMLQREDAAMIRYFFNGFILYNRKVPDVIRLAPSNRDALIKAYHDLGKDFAIEPATVVGKFLFIPSGQFQGAVGVVQKFNPSSRVCSVMVISAGMWQGQKIVLAYSDIERHLTAYRPRGNYIRGKNSAARTMYRSQPAQPQQIERPSRPAPEPNPKYDDRVAEFYEMQKKINEARLANYARIANAV